MRKVTVLLTTIALLALAAGCDWTQPGAGPGHTFFTPDTSFTLEQTAFIGPRWASYGGGDPDLPPGAVTGPVVSRGVLYGTDPATGQVVAHPADGSPSEAQPDCLSGGTPCLPLWRGAPHGPVSSSSAAVDGDTVLAQFSDGPVEAYDAAGAIGCSGTPTTCNPLWVSTGGLSGSGLTVAGGRVYSAFQSATSAGVAAFDSAGSEGCGGTPTVCSPVWIGRIPSLDRPSQASVLNGAVYVVSHRVLYAFDATGATNCSGAPLTCDPLWTAPLPADVSAAPTATAGRVLVVTGPTLSVFDAAGTGCPGTPRVCSPLWTAGADPTVANGGAPPVVAKGIVYLPRGLTMAAFDLAGSPRRCTRRPVPCKPLWQYSLTNPENYPSRYDGAAVANGVLYVASSVLAPKPFATLAFFDATGTVECTTTTTPKTCNPYATTFDFGAFSSGPVVANGFVYEEFLGFIGHVGSGPSNPIVLAFG